MDIQTIIQNEEQNDGSSVFLYYNDEVGFYTAYGFSAFLVSHIVDPVCSYSPCLQMPVALVSKPEILELRRSLKKVKHVEKSFYQFELRKAVGKTGYTRWANSLKK